MVAPAGWLCASGSPPDRGPSRHAAWDRDGALAGRETVLLVDDEPAVRRTGSRILSRVGYAVVLAEDGQEAVACLEREAGRIALIITDMVMPRMDACDLVRIVRRRWPMIPVILSTGYDMGRLAGGELELFNRFIPKPYTPEEILRAVRETLDGLGRA